MGGAMDCSMRILLVDDEQDLREAIAHILRESGHAVTECENGSDALATFQEDPFPVVISDLIMNGMTGVELLAKVKQFQPATEVIIMTGFASEETAVAALRNGAFDYLMKTYENLQLLPDVVKRAGEKYRLTEEQQTKLDSLRQMNTTLEHALRALQNAAAFDELPGLYNNHFLQEALEGEVGRSVTFKRSFSLLLFQIDGIADRGGPERTERTQLLSDVTGAIKQRIRRSDIFARYDEQIFAIILPETARAGAEIVVENIRQLLTSDLSPRLKSGSAGGIEIIAATAAYPEDGGDGAALIRHALEALKAQKKLSGAQPQE
jgi:two-component system, cell cycle response regulator